MPDPFPLPRFRYETEENFKKGILLDTDRKHCVQTIAMTIMQYVSRPSLGQCGLVAKALMKKYPFLMNDGEEEVATCSFFDITPL